MGKPSNWDKLKKKEKQEIAGYLLESMRGQYIISQALYYAIETLKKVPKLHRENSNIEDMEILKETFFWMFIDPKIRKKIKNKKK